MQEITKRRRHTSKEFMQSYFQRNLNEKLRLDQQNLQNTNSPFKQKNSLA